MTRLIHKKDIPTSLWNNDESVLKLPPQLISEWIRLLDKNDLRDKAVGIAPKGFEGGVSREDTDNHLAWRFTGSCARVILAMLDPKEELSETTDAFARTFAGNKVFLADLPCGSGAATVSILTTLAELRKQNRIPRMPLDIVILGGEISEFACAYTSESLMALKSELADQAITIDFEIIHWDVCDKQSNTDLIKRLVIKSESCSEKFLILANFSGFLENSGKWKQAEKQIEKIFEFSSDTSSIAIWIEPNKNNVTNGFMPRVISWFEKWIPSFLLQNESSTKNYEISTIHVGHPLKNHRFNTGLIIKLFNLTR